jgi:hypothetical protein
MNNQQAIIRHLFNKESLEEVPVEVLESYAQENPLFGAGQFFLAKKYQQTANESFGKQVQKAALYFTDPLWLHFQLSSFQVNDAPTLQPPSPLIWEPSVESHDKIEEVVNNQEEVASIRPEPEEFTPVITPEPEKTPEPEEVLVTPAIEDKTEPGDNLEAEDTFIDTVGVPAASFLVNEPQPYSASPGETFSEPQAGNTNIESDVQKTEPPIPEATPVVSPAADKPRHPLFPGNGDDEAGGNKITFEPFHTVDYFASQGIKVSGEIKDDDRLGKQMKSFTEWLKTMRRLPEAKVEAELEKINDREIERLAAHSLDENEVVTEAMAEVLTKQGKQREAKDLYRKLSLLNPGKSAYFAAKIEALNH